MDENRSFFKILVLFTIVMMSWQYFYEIPRLKKLQSISKSEAKISKSESDKKKLEKLFEVREDSLKDSPRISLSNSQISGSIALKGAKIDDISLNSYNEEIDNENNKVKLLSPTKFKNSYFLEFGWLNDQEEKSKIDMPDKDSLWQANKQKLSPGEPLELSWSNSQNITFKIFIELDDLYLFKVKQTIINNSHNNIAYKFYGRINRIYEEDSKSFAILHEGPLGIFNGKLEESKFSKLKTEKNQVFEANNLGSWFGITDKYWLASIIPQDRKFDTNFSYVKSKLGPRYQVDFSADDRELAPGEYSENISYVFLGPKKLSLLESYGKKLNITLFDRAVDFGWFYFLTKPMFYCLKFLYDISTNFGVAIILLTFFVKLMMLPMAKKSHESMTKMKEMQPKINKLKELYGNDKLRLNQETMAIYRKENINPMSGCLPLLIQIPVFFSLYKVLFVTIEMRHARFFGWIKDLSAPDPTSIVNFFGLAPWPAPQYLSIGIWPIVMGITMYLQQKHTPQPADPVQAKLMKFLPLIFTFMFYKFPAGLIIYWAFNNILSILQQYFLAKKTKLYEKKKS